MNMQNDLIIDIIKRDDENQLIEYLKKNEINYYNILYKTAIDSNNLNLLTILYNYDTNKCISIIEHLYNYNLLNLEIFTYLTEEIKWTFYNEPISNNVKIEIIDSLIYSNNTIITLLLNYKNKNTLSKKELNSIIFNKLILTIFVRLCYTFLINRIIVDHLLQLKIDINGYDKNGKTALIVACENGNKKLVEYLIQNDVDINKSDENGNIPIITACNNFNRSLLRILIENNVNLNVTDKEGNSPLIIECQNLFSSDLIESFINHGANVNVINQHGCTALMKACENTKENFENFLIKHGSEIANQEDPNGYVFLGISCEKRNENIIKLLVEHGADINVVDEKGNTAIKLAKNTGKKNVVKYLIKMGANVDTDDISLTISEEKCLKQRNKNKSTQKYLIFSITMISIIIIIIIIFIIII